MKCGSFFLLLQEQLQAKVYKNMVGASIGTALFPKEGNDFDEVMKQADIDMYRQKVLHEVQTHKEQD